MPSDESWGAQPASYCCSWEDDGGAFTVRLLLRVVKWLGSHSTDGPQASAPPGGPGGILLGRTHLEAGRETILIEGFVPVPCTYGEDWHLSDKDKWLFKEQLARWHPEPDKKLYAVGCYRSRSSEDFHLGAQELILAREFMANQASVSLLVRRSSFETSVGGFVFRQNGEIGRLPDLTVPSNKDFPPTGQTTLPILPADSRLLEVEAGLSSGVRGTRAAELGLGKGYEQSRDVAGSEQSSTSLPFMAPRETLFLALPPSNESIVARALKEQWHSLLDAVNGLNWKWRHVVFSVLAVAFGIAGCWGVYVAWDKSYGVAVLRETNALIDQARAAIVDRPENTKRIASLDLEVAKQKGHLRLSWRKDAPWIASSSGGILAIKDGPRQKDFYLDPPGLQTGAFDFAHQTGDVTFRLSLKSSDGLTSEWVRVVGVHRLPGTVSAIKPHSRGWIGPGSLTDDNISLAASRLSGRFATSRRRSLKSAGVAELAAHGLSPPLVVLDETRKPRTVPPETLDASHASLPATQEKGSEVLAGAGARPEESNRSARGADGQQASPAPPDTVADPASAADQVTQSIQHVPLFRLTAYLAPGMRTVIPEGTKVEVRVYVNKTGRVTRAEPVTKSGANAHAMRWALRAAGELRFHPPQRDGKNIASESVIEFEFPGEIVAPGKIP